jgi:transcriptional regulator with XRE-family HTH domain
MRNLANENVECPSVFIIMNPWCGSVMAEASPDDVRRAVSVPLLGATIRRLRQTKSFTLQELADASGVSVGMISQIERDLANPSLRVLCQLRDALEASIGELLADELPDTGDPAGADPDFVVRGSDRRVLELGYVRKQLLSPTRQGSTQLMILELPPHAASGELRSPHEKGGLVIEGACVLTVAGEEALLEEGDSFLFDGTEAHSFRNPHASISRLLWVMAPPRVERHL